MQRDRGNSDGRFAHPTVGDTFSNNDKQKHNSNKVRWAEVRQVNEAQPILMITAGRAGRKKKRSIQLLKKNHSSALLKF